MKIAFFSNFLNHHQLPLCKKLDEITDGNFVFVATTPVPEARKDLGYHDMNKEYPFVLTTYDSLEGDAEAMKLAEECDVMIIGSAPEKYVKHRMQENKLTFRYSERLYKKGYIYALYPKWQAYMKKAHRIYKYKPVYMLCASAFTAGDFAFSGAYKGKTYKWGYFPEVTKSDIETLNEKKSKNEKLHLLWVGRLINWKHPDDALKVADRLKKDGYDFEMNMIGIGDMQDELARTIEKKGLSDCVFMRGSMSPEEVREYMDTSDIFLFTSDKGEGWGAVLNEAMSSGCAVVASDAIGSVGFLLNNGENGMIYRSGSINSLYSAVKLLASDCNMRNKLGREAHRTMQSSWTPEEAARRLICLCQALKSGEDTPFENGPCSIAERRYY